MHVTALFLRTFFRVASAIESRLIIMDMVTERQSFSFLATVVIAKYMR